jgi:hypothetical protein
MCSTVRWKQGSLKRENLGQESMIWCQRDSNLNCAPNYRILTTYAVAHEKILAQQLVDVKGMGKRRKSKK